MSPQRQENPSATARRRASGDGGAALVEFALIMPILFLLVFAIIEFGWGFYQNADVRHGAREAGRLAAVNYKVVSTDTGPGQTSKIVVAACQRMDAPPNTTLQFGLTNTNGNAVVGDIGDTIRVQVRKPLDQLTGFLGPVLDGKVLSSDIDIRVEQNVTWTPNGTPESC